MYHNSVFSNLVKQIDRGVVKQLVQKHGSDRNSKGFGSWQHMIAMLHCHLSGANSLREAETLYNSHAGTHYHLQLPALKRSTLSQANNRRSPLFFKEIAAHLLARCQKIKGADSLLRVIDSSPIQVLGRNNQWTKNSRCARIDGLKLHLSIEPTTRCLEYLDITEAKINDITAIQQMPLESGKIYVFDKGYCDYNWWHAIKQSGSIFVTRLKENAACKAIKDHEISEENQWFILKDETIVLTNKAPRGGKINTLAGVPLRRITIARTDKKPLVLVCNDMEKAADIIAQHYKDRWKIELLFKWLKRYLHVKTFLGETENSIKIQLYCAIIVYCLLWLHRHLHQQTQDLTHTVILIQATLFTRPQTIQERQRRYHKKMHKYQQLAIQGLL